MAVYVFISVALSTRPSRRRLMEKGSLPVFAMTKDHPDWDKFMARLCGQEGVNFRQKKKAKVGTICTCGHEPGRPLAKAILQKMGVIDIPNSMGYFTRQGWKCDCQIARSSIVVPPKRPVVAQGRDSWSWLLGLNR